MKKRNLDEEKDIYIGNTKTIDLDKLSLKEFKKHIIKHLAVPHMRKQCYLTIDPLTEKYLFWHNGQVRFISTQVIERMLKREQLKYYSAKTFRIENMIVSGGFITKKKIDIIKTGNNLRDMFTKRKRKRQL